MTHAIDVEDIVEFLFRGYAKVAGPQIISTFWASNPDIEPVEFDPDRAEELLEEAGYERRRHGICEKDGKPLQFTLITNSREPAPPAHLREDQGEPRGHRRRWPTCSRSSSTR